MVNHGIKKMSEMTEQYKKYNYPLFIVNDRDEPEQIGTFLMLRTGTSHYLLTAAHVASECNLRGYHTFAGDKWIEFSGELLKTDGLDDDVYDVAVLKVNENVPVSDFNAVTEEMLMAPDSSLGKIFSFMGYPASKTKIDRPSKHLKTILHVYYNTSCQQDVYTKAGLKPHHHIAITFNKKKCLTDDQQNIVFPDPQGMSGGGIWLHDIITGDTRLAGIASTNKKLLKCLYGTHISLFWEIVTRDSLNRE